MNTLHIVWTSPLKIYFLKKQIKFGIHILAFLFFISTQVVFSQKVGINKSDPQEALDVNGKIRVGNDNSNPVTSSGTIRFNPETGDFEGYTGNDWESFTKNPGELFWPAYRDRGAIGNYVPLSLNEAVQGEEFGYAVDIDGIYAVVGCPGWNGNSGKVIVYKREPIFGFWNAIETIYGASGVRLGHSVSISGSRIAIGAPKTLGTFAGVTTEVGAYYVYKMENNAAILEHSAFGQFGCGFNLGTSIDIFGQEVVVGATNATPPVCTPNNNGVVYYKNLSNETLIYYYPNLSSPTSMNQFGHAVSMTIEWLAIGAPFSSGTNEDSVYIYRRPLGGFFTPFQTLAADYLDDQFGSSLEIYGNTLVVGGKGEDWIAGDNRGKTKIYNFDATLNKWVVKATVVGSDNDCGLGHAVACDANYQLMSANVDLTNNSTEMLTFKLIDGSYRRYVGITDPAATLTDNTVNDVALSGNYFIIGLPYGISDNGLQGGRVFIGRIR